MKRFARSIAIALSLWAVALPMTAAAQPSPTSSTSTPKPQTVLLSAAGGISKGAYQGGVDWTVTEYMRRHRDTFALGSVSGASAGNVDALFAALSWCTAALRGDASGEIAAEKSLFWDAWTTTGTAQILPLKGPSSNEPSILDRQVFRAANLRRIETFMRGVAARPGCEIPIGLTLTKLNPTQIAIQEQQATASVQRFASAILVKSVNDGDRSVLDFAAVPGVEQRASLGALALMPSLSNSARESFTIRLSDVVDVVLASSAFPVAFAPVRLHYWPGGLAYRGADARDADAFVDGGVFDNNPLGLAARLFELRHDPEQSSQLAYDVAISSPLNFRGKLKDARPMSAPVDDRVGLASIGQLVSGAIQSGRQYELQSFARLLALETENGSVQANQRKVLLSSRAAPIFGETLASFGAFLGRPFREYDFYAGIYDGLEFVARRLICPRQPARNPETCTTEEHTQLITGNGMHLSLEAQHVMSWLLRAEYGYDWTPASTPTDSDRLKILRAVHDAIEVHRTQKPDAVCSKDDDLIRGRLCECGLGEALAQLAAIRTQAVAAHNACVKDAPGRDVEKSGECFVDQDFVDLVNNPDQRVYQFMKKALENLENAEDSIKNKNENSKGAIKAPEFSAWIETAFALFRADTLKYRRGIHNSGIELNLSTGRFDLHHKFASVVGVIMPNYVQAAWTSGLSNDPFIIGWRPVSWLPGRATYVSTSLELATQRNHVSLTPGVSLGTFQKWMGPLSSSEIGVAWLGDTRRREDLTDRRAQARVSLRFLSDKIQVTWWQDVTRLRNHSFGIGISDVNGVLYWILR